MDLVYVLKNTPTEWADNEIRYSLRSLDKYGSGYDRIFIIGGKPSFLDYDKIIHLEHVDNYHVVEYNVFRKLVYLSENTDITDNFILFNDDFYLLQEMDLSKMPYYYKRERIAVKYKCSNTFNDMAVLTRQFLLKYKKTIYDFKPHYPIIYNKQKLKELEQLYKLAFKTSPLGLSLRDLYGNWHNVPHKIFKNENKMMGRNVDVNEFVKNLDLFSSGNVITESEMNFLINKYPNKSKWEL